MKTPSSMPIALNEDMAAASVGELEQQQQQQQGAGGKSEELMRRKYKCFPEPFLELVGTSSFFFTTNESAGKLLN